MDKWEAILKLYTYHPDVNRFKCSVCGRLYKTSTGVYRHIDKTHNAEINDLRDNAI